LFELIQTHTTFFSANTLKVPDYRFLADRVFEVVKKFEEEVAKIPEKQLKDFIIQPEVKKPAAAGDAAGKNQEAGNKAAAKPAAGAGDNQAAKK
uniref:Glycine--tRNA ligase n=1 Tax=Anisakis simplex TaxID=6269 RepID=A0A0M3KBE0_ANISI